MVENYPLSRKVVGTKQQARSSRHEAVGMKSADMKATGMKAADMKAAGTKHCRHENREAGTEMKKEREYVAFSFFPP